MSAGIPRGRVAVGVDELLALTQKTFHAFAAFLWNRTERLPDPAQMPPRARPG